MREDPRKILGLAANAEADEIRQVYRRLVKIHHPDAGGDPERFKQINGAYLRLISQTQAVLCSGPHDHRIRVVYGKGRSYGPGYLMLRRILRPRIIWTRGRTSFSIPLVLALAAPALGWAFNPTATIIGSAGFLALGKVKYSNF